MNIRKIPFILNFLLFLITLYLNLMTCWNSEVWKGFIDVKDYLRQSEISVFSKDFFFAKPEPGYYPRPFTVPLFYKIAGNRGETIVQMQKFMHSLSVFVLVFSFLLLMKTGIARYFTIFFVYLLMSWWNILGWSTQLLSESLSDSFLFLWIGTFVIWYVRRKPWILMIHALVTVLFSFTRDSWPYILVLLYIIVFVIAWLRERPLLKGSLFLLLLSVAIFFIQGKSAEVGQRTKLPVINNILLRIMPETRHYAWFIARGMPDAALLRHEYTGVDLSIEAGRWKVYNLYTDHRFRKFHDWAAGDGRKLYIRFLITHPAYTMLITEPESKLERILDFNLKYTAFVNGYSLFAEDYFPFFSPMSFLVFSLILAWLFVRTKKTRLLMPLIFGLLFLFNVFLIYNADTMEVARHLFITRIMVELLSILAVGLLVDETILKMRSL